MLTVRDELSISFVLSGSNVLSFIDVLSVIDMLSYCVTCYQLVICFLLGTDCLIFGEGGLEGLDRSKFPATKNEKKLCSVQLRKQSSFKERA